MALDGASLGIQQFDLVHFGKAAHQHQPFASERIDVHLGFVGRRVGWRVEVQRHLRHRGGRDHAGQALGRHQQLLHAAGQQGGGLACTQLLLGAQPLGPFGQGEQPGNHQRHHGEQQHRHRQGAAQRVSLGVGRGWGHVNRGRRTNGIVRHPE
jgi:hypothetical protein